MKHATKMNHYQAQAPCHVDIVNVIFQTCYHSVDVSNFQWVTWRNNMVQQNYRIKVANLGGKILEFDESLNIMHYLTHVIDHLLSLTKKVAVSDVLFV